MLLNSVRRIKLSLEKEDNSVETNRKVAKWLLGASGAIERVLNRQVELKSIIEEFDIRGGQNIVHVRAFPITSITKIETDSRSAFSGSQNDITSSCNITGNASTILSEVVIPEGHSTLRASYIGGLAVHAVNSVFDSTFTLATGATAPIVGQYVRGVDSFAEGRITVLPTMPSVPGNVTGDMTIEVVAGVFIPGEIVVLLNSVKQERDEDANVVIVLNTLTTPSLVDVHPNIITAVEIEVRYMMDHQSDFENTGTTPKGGTSRRSSDSMVYNLQPETMQWLSRYIRTTI